MAAAPSSSVQPTATNDIPLDSLKPDEATHTTTATTPSDEEGVNTASAIQPLELTPSIKLKIASATLAFFNTGINVSQSRRKTLAESQRSRAPGSSISGPGIPL